MKTTGIKILLAVTGILLSAIFAVLFYVLLDANYNLSDIGKIKIASVTRAEIQNHVWPSQKKIDVDSIKIFIVPDFHEKKIAARETIYLRKSAAARTVLNLNDNAGISAFSVNGLQTEFLHINSHIVINNLRDSVLAIRLEYSVRPDAGLFFTENQNGKFIYSLNEPVFASGWFACNDTPSDKFFFETSVSVDSGLTVISNGNEIKREVAGNRKISTWRSAYPVASYLVALYVGNYSVLTKKINGVEYYVYSFPQDKDKSEGVLQTMSSAVKILENKLTRYPFSKDKLAIVETDWNYGGAENQTAIMLGAKFFSAEYFKDVIVHEIAHSWFGNSVGVSTWDDVWLIEGGATYCEALYWEALAGKEGYEAAVNSFRNENKNEPVRARKSNLFARTVYVQGALLFDDLRKQSGDKFFPAIKNFLEKYDYKTVDCKIFKEETEKFYGKDLTSVFNRRLKTGCENL